MEYSDLLKSHEEYGNSKQDILLRHGFDKILKFVIIAPWWDIGIFEEYNPIITKINDSLYNIKINDVEFSFVQLKMIGASVIMDTLLSLGITNCQNILFIGSVGSLSTHINIGDIVIPKYSICGDGASRYLNPNLEDEFGKKEYPNEQITNKLLDVVKDVCKETKVNYHYVSNFSIDTIFAQFYHINYILNTGCETIEMETANFFKTAKTVGLNATALLCISDNTINKKSLYSGRTTTDNDYRKFVKSRIIPEIIIQLIKNLNK